MSNCIYLKQKLNNKLECKYKKKIISIKECANCPYKEYKIPNNLQLKCKNRQNFAKSPIKTGKTGIKPEKIKKRSSKLAKLERNRFSLFTDDLEHCIICGKSPINKHEIFGGRNRLNSIKYGLVIPLCICEHHDQVNCTGIHFDKKLRDEWHKKGQAFFEKTYPDLDFIEIFGKNYL